MLFRSKQPAPLDARRRPQICRLSRTATRPASRSASAASTRTTPARSARPSCAAPAPGPSLPCRAAPGLPPLPPSGRVRGGEHQSRDQSAPEISDLIGGRGRGVEVSGRGWWRGGCWVSGRRGGGCRWVVDEGGADGVGGRGRALGRRSGVVGGRRGQQTRQRGGRRGGAIARISHGWEVAVPGVPQGARAQAVRARAAP
mgnify:CR=1 FL=1